MHATRFAGMALNDSVGIDDRQLVSVGGNTEFVARYNGDLREKRARRFPTFSAAADVIVRALARDRDRNFLVGTVAEESPACEILGGGFQAVINRRVNGNRLSHGQYLLR
jgi:hypothetical protein